MTRFSFAVLALLFACGKPLPDEGLRVGDESGEFHVVSAEFTDHFALLRGGKMRVTAHERGVPADARIVRASIDNPAIATIEPDSVPGLAVRVDARNVGATAIHVTTESGRAFDATIEVEEAGASELFVVADAPSACELSPHVWFNLQPLLSSRGVIYDVTDFVHEELSLAATARTRSGEARSGWGGLAFASSVAEVGLGASWPSAFHFGLETIEFADVRTLSFGRYRGPVVISVGPSEVPVEITEHAEIASVRTYVVTGGLRDLPHPDVSTEGAPLRMSTVFLGEPRECADVVVLPFAADGRPIVGMRGQTSFTSGEEHVTLRGLRANVLGLIGRSLGSADVRVTFGSASASVHVDVVEGKH